MHRITNSDIFRENVRSKFQTLLSLNTDTAGINLEKGVYNYAIKEATRQKTVKKWENPQFVTIYTARLRSI